MRFRSKMKQGRSESYPTEIDPMKLIDTNILIYAGDAALAHSVLPYVTNSANFVSVVSHVETLGFHKITPAQIRFFESTFKILQTLDIDVAIVKKAIELRQMKKMSLGDSLIAATALVHRLEIVSRNTIDFSGIPSLRVINPIP